jgi:hypothetical protein
VHNSYIEVNKLDFQLTEKTYIYSIEDKSCGISNLVREYKVYRNSVTELTEYAPSPKLKIDYSYYVRYLM